MVLSEVLSLIFGAWKTPTDETHENRNRVNLRYTAYYRGAGFKGVDKNQIFKT